MKTNILFSERQNFRNWWTILVLIVINGIFLWGIVQQIFLDKPFGTRPISDTSLIMLSIVMLGFTFYFLNFHLDTSITEDGIYVYFFPFHFSIKHYDWNSISKLYIRKYSPFIEYGGWGVKRGWYRKGMAYTVSGNKGLQIVFSNNKKLLIGTKHAEELENILKKLEQLKP